MLMPMLPTFMKAAVLILGGLGEYNYNEYMHLHIRCNDCIHHVIKLMSIITRSIVKIHIQSQERKKVTNEKRRKLIHTT